MIGIWITDTPLALAWRLYHPSPVPRSDQRGFFDSDANLENLLLDPFFEEAVENAQEARRAVVAWPLCSAFPSWPSVPPYVTTMVTGSDVSCKTCCRRNVTILEPTRIKGWTKKGLSTPNGCNYEKILRTFDLPAAFALKVLKRDLEVAAVTATSTGSGSSCLGSILPHDRLWRNRYNKNCLHSVQLGY